MYSYIALTYRITFLPSSDDNNTVFSEWITYDVFTRVTGVSSIKCAINQYLSGLSFTLDSMADAYHWWGRCSNFSAGYTKRVGMCWTSDVTLVQGSNGSLSLPGERVVIDGMRIAYQDYDTLYHMRWSYIFCLVLDGMYMYSASLDLPCDSMTLYNYIKYCFTLEKL